MMRRADFTVEELQEIRSSIGSELDILDESFADPRDRENPDIDRGRQRRVYITCENILDKIHKVLKDSPPKERPKGAEVNEQPSATKKSENSGEDSG